MNLLKLDHLVVSSATLAQGTTFVEKELGVTMAAGGEHPALGTHNRLLSLGSDVYFEVISINPDATAPSRPRWFNIDNFNGPPRLTNWVLQTPDLDAALDALPDGFGTPMSLSRGDLKWRMAIPDSGILPWKGWAPAIIEWDGNIHPAPRLPESDVRLELLTLKHPDAAAMAEVFAPLMPRDTALFEVSDTPELRAVFDTPSGKKTLK